MARKKRQPQDSKPKRRQPADGPALPDRRALEGMLRQLTAGLEAQAGQGSPLGKAQEFLDRAYREPDHARRVQLARDALALWPDCADAYVLLAEDAPNRKEALRFYEQGVAAGERALGAEAFQRDAGRFWGLLETRPYLRARLGLAHLLWTSGRRDEAVRHLQDLLRLNPNDNQGVRYTLASFLLFLDRDADLAALLQQYPDEDSATWAYSRALLAFRREGDTLPARQSLKKARKANKHVPDYLLGRKLPPAESPSYYSPGDEAEAQNYAGGFLVSWKSTPGAVAWLRANSKTRKGKSDKPEPKGPLAFIKKWLKERLPQAADVWQAECRQVPNWLRIGGEPMRPWVVLVTSRTKDLVLAHELTEEEPTPAFLWDVLVQALQHPAAGEPHRPAELQVRADERWESLRPAIEEIGVRLLVADQLDQIGIVFDSLTDHVGGKPRPGLLDMPGITPAQVAGFYEAAASFFRQAPWKKVGYESAIQIECDRFQGGPWYAVLMGQSGLEMGVALYEDLAALHRLWASPDDDEENARETVGTSVTFGEEWELPVADVEAARRHGWQVARPDAYPTIFHKDRGLTTRPPLAWELELLEGCLRVLPEFVNRRQDDPTREEITVRTASGELRLGVSWVSDA